MKKGILLGIAGFTFLAGIKAQIPVAGFTSDATVICSGGYINFTDTSTGDPTSWYWYFGDGFYSYQQNPNHCFTTPGTYWGFLQVSNSFGTDTESIYVTVLQPLVDISPVATQCGLCDGSATATVSGGTSPYIYLWNDANSQTVPTATGLCSGIYYVTVTDSSGCSNSDSVNITENAFTASVTSENISCKGANNGTAAVTTTGGIAPYAYLWSNGANDSLLNGLSAGTIFITVTDVNNCIASDSAIINEPPLLVISITTENVTCNGNCNGSATLNITGGTSPYSFVWSNGGSGTNLCAGNYFITVTDVNNCAITEAAIIEEPDSILVSFSYSDVTCNGNCDGTATPIISGGTSPYTYWWNDGEDGTNLCPGNHSMTVVDSKSCITFNSISIVEPNELTLLYVVTPDSGNSNGTVTPIISGGTSPYSYLWSNGQTDSIATGLNSGNYFITVTDANGCTLTDSVFVPLYVGIKSENISKSSEFTIYPNPASSSVTITAKGGDEIRIFDVTGREIKRMKNFQSSLNLSTEEIENGIYFLSLHKNSGDIVATEKLIIAR